jgi:simple sugar transport system substrate-binding protein/ribose transport system substrate-binding protein
LRSTIKALAGALCGIVLAAACGGGSSGSSSSGSLQSGQSFKLGVSLTFNNTDFWTNYINYESRFAGQYHAQLIGPLVANNDTGKQLADVRTLIAQGAQALIVNPVDSAAIAPALDYAASKHVPVVSVDVAPTNGKVFMIVRADNVLYGQEACQYIGGHAQGSGHVAVLQGDLASLNGRDRSDGFKQCIQQKYPNLQIAEYPTKWDTPTAVNDARTAIGAYSDLKGIYVQWSGPVSGILEAERATGKFVPVGASGHIIMVSNDGVPFEHQDIRQGLLDATVSQPANAYAQYAVLYARNALEGKTFSNGQSTDHSSKIVTLSGNLEDAIQAPVVDKANVDDPGLWGNAK